MEVFNKGSGVIKALKELKEIAKSLPTGINAETIERFSRAKILLPQTIYGRNLKASTKIVDVFGYRFEIWITGSYISIADTRKFYEIANLASNFEVYPRTDGKVQMNFVFADSI